MHKIPQSLISNIPACMNSPITLPIFSSCFVDFIKRAEDNLSFFDKDQINTASCMDFQRLRPSIMKRSEGQSSKFLELPEELQQAIWRSADEETPYNPENEEGKIWQSSNIVNGERRLKMQNVHTVNCISTLLPWKQFKHGRRRHATSELVATNSTKTHALLRTCRMSRNEIIRHFKLFPAFGTLVSFDYDVFLFDFSWSTLPFQYVNAHGGHPILHMPELASKIKHLAIYEATWRSISNIPTADPSGNGS